MKRPRTTSFASPPPAIAGQSTPDHPSVLNWRELAPIVAAVICTLNAMEVSPRAGPVVKVHRSALRRQGEAAAAIGGTEAMEAVLQEVADTDPTFAERRRSIIAEAWSGLSGWRS